MTKALGAEGKGTRKTRAKRMKSKGEGYEKGEKQRASKQKSLGDRFSDMADPLTSQS